MNVSCINIKGLLSFLLLVALLPIHVHGDALPHVDKLCFADSIYAGDRNLYSPYMAEPLPATAPDWMKAISDSPSKVNFYNMQKKFIEWTSQNVDARVKTVEYKQAVNFYRRWMSAYRKYVSHDGTIVLPTIDEYAAMVDDMNRRSAVQEGNPIWRNIGPNTTYTNNNGVLTKKDHQVCVYRIAVALTDSATLYCGTESGMVFKTVDHGITWKPCAPTHNFGGSIFSVAIDPYDKNKVYVGGGPWLWKSVDGGDTWSRCNGINSRVNSIRISPENPQYITASAGSRDDEKESNGFFVSQDGGNTFTCTMRGICFDHELQPGNPNVVYLLRREEVGPWTYFYLSDNGGFNWTRKELPISMVICGRLSVSEAAAGENYVYALVTSDIWGTDRGPQGGMGTPYVLLSKDAGQTWDDKTVNKGSWHWDNTFSPIMDEQGGQGYFDMMIGASNKNPAHVLFGLTSLYRSTEEGVCNYRDHGIGGYQRNDWMHCDIQDIAMHPCGDTWICNDGGIKYSRDFFETKGEDRHYGIYASDYQGLGVGWNEDVMASGRWHNGDVVHAASYGEGNSVHVGGVEIATGYVMKSNPWKVYFTDAATRIMPREMDGSIVEDYKTWFQDKKPNEALRICGDIATDPRYALKVFIQDMTNTLEGYLSYDEGESFQKVFDSDGEDFYSYEFARTNPNRVYVSGTWNIWRSDDGAESFYKCESRPFPNLDSNMHFTRVVVDPNDENHVIVICNDLNGMVSESFDGGVSWSPYNLASLSDMRIHQIILVGDEYNSCYVTSYDGAYVYFKDNTMTDFIDYSSGLCPGARISKVVPLYKEGVLRMATDRGLWEAPLYHRDFTPIAQPMALNLGSGNLTQNPNKEVQFDSYSIVRQDENTRWQWSFSPQPQYINDAYIRNPKVIFGHPGNYDVTLTVTTPTGSSSRTIKNMITIEGETSVDNVEIIGEVGIVNAVFEKGEPLSLVLSGLDADAVLTIHSARGQLLHSVAISHSDELVEVYLPMNESATYIYQIKSATKKFFGKFIIK
ncbi:MAG: hypothetical protein IKD40_07460 [Bacteroidaceae bacterium]|nr:hypothetical protein [Bacteroidaceae bacterium]